MNKERCQGNFKPVFKSVKHTSKNPHYLSADPNIIAKENVTDEFITLDVKTQEGWACMDCNRADCMDIPESESQPFFKPMVVWHQYLSSCRENCTHKPDGSVASMFCLQITPMEINQLNPNDESHIDPWKDKEKGKHYEKFHHLLGEKRAQLLAESRAIYWKAFKEAFENEVGSYEEKCEMFEAKKVEFGYYEAEALWEEEFKKMPTNIYVIPD